MRVGILTFHRAVNYGAVLQAYALKETIESLGHTANVVDYRNSYLEQKRYRFSGDLPLLPRIKQAIRSIYPNEKTRSCQKFLSSRLNLTGDYDRTTIAESNGLFDAFVVGSDQVWNPELTDSDKSYFLDFVDDGKKKISYAASFGTEGFSSRTASAIGPLIDDFDNISVRERSGIRLCADMGVTKHVTCVLDPTLLAYPAMWESIAGYAQKQFNQYILLYMLRDSKELLKEAERLSKQYGMRIVSVSPVDGLDGIITPKHMSVESFVELFSRARYVLTNSFHGMCLSIQFKRQFCYELYKGTGRHFRLEELAESLGLKDRELTLGHSPFDNQIDYSPINDNLSSLRDESLAFLSKALE